MSKESLDNLRQESGQFKISNTTLSTNQKIKLMELACNLPNSIGEYQNWEGYFKKMTELITGTPYNHPLEYIVPFTNTDNDLLEKAENDSAPEVQKNKHDLLHHQLQVLRLKKAQLQLDIDKTRDPLKKELLLAESNLTSLQIKQVEYLHTSLLAPEKASSDNSRNSHEGVCRE